MQVRGSDDGSGFSTNSKHIAAHLKTGIQNVVRSGMYVQRLSVLFSSELMTSSIVHRKKKACLRKSVSPWQLYLSHIKKKHRKLKWIRHAFTFSADELKYWWHMSLQSLFNCDKWLNKIVPRHLQMQRAQWVHPQRKLLKLEKLNPFVGIVPKHYTELMKINMHTRLRHISQVMCSNKANVLILRNNTKRPHAIASQ